MALYIFFYNKGRGVPLPYPPRPTKGGGHPSLTNPDPIHAAPATRLEILMASFIPIFFIYFIKGRGTPLPYPPRSNPYSPATRLQTAQLTSWQASSHKHVPCPPSLETIHQRGYRLISKSIAVFELKQGPHSKNAFAKHILVRFQFQKELWLRQYASTGDCIDLAYLEMFLWWRNTKHTETERKYREKKSPSTHTVHL